MPLLISFRQKFIFGSSENTFASCGLEVIKFERVKNMTFGS